MEIHSSGSPSVERSISAVRRASAEINSSLFTRSRNSRRSAGVAMR